MFLKPILIFPFNSNIEKARAILKSCGRNLNELAMASSTATNEISEEEKVRISHAVN